MARHKLKKTFLKLVKAHPESQWLQRSYGWKSIMGERPFHGCAIGIVGYALEGDSILNLHGEAYAARAESAVKKAFGFNQRMIGEIENLNDIAKSKDCFEKALESYLTGKRDFDDAIWIAKGWVDIENS